MGYRFRFTPHIHPMNAFLSSANQDKPGFNENYFIALHFYFIFFNMRQTPSSNTISNACIIHPILDSVQNSLKSLNLFFGYSFSVSHDPKILATFLQRSNNPHSSNQKYIISCKWTFGISYGDSSL